MNLRIYCVLPLCLLFACDKTERDWSKCSDAAACAQGYTCSPDSLCVLAVDAAAEVAAPAADAGGLEVAGLDTVDAPLEVAAEVAMDLVADVAVDVGLAVDVTPDVAVDVIVDVAVALDVAVDVAVADAVADLSVDRRPVDSQGSCSSDNDCPDSGPLCLAFRCAKCKTSNDCLSRADSGAGGGVCEPTSGRCVACAKSGDCTADPSKPVCVGNLCVACSSAANECRVKNPSAPVCANNGKCVGCLVSSDCTSSADGGVDGGADGGAAAGFCNTTTNQCVGCLEHDDCSDPNKPICGSSQTCVGCGSPGVSAGTCASKKPAVPVCKPDTGACVECTGNADCRGDAGLGVCNPTTNKCVECNGNADCTADSAKGFCVNNSCTGCQTAGTGACTGAKPVCAASGSYVGQCVECAGNTDCKVATKPVCDTDQCRPCAKDLECTGISPAVVCGLDGSCPADSAVIYLQNSSSCPGGNGTLASPYCSSDDATAALSATKTVIVVKGNGVAYPVGPLTLGAVASSRVLVAGQSSAKITNLGVGSHILVNITAGDVTLRDLTISGGNDAGVSVSGGATLHMDRCYVLNNTAYGIITTNSAFDIANTVIAGNGTDGLSSGAGLGAYTGTGPKRFAFNTVVNNGLVGVACGSSYTLTGILANGNGGLNFSASCVTDSTTSTASPNLDANYHLTSSSFCRDHGGATCPLDDIDGDTRPIGTACDCGADEYKP